MAWPTPTPNPVNIPISEEKLQAISAAIFRGQKIEAIKLYRDCTNTSLMDAKQAVERLEADLRAASPEKFSAPPRRAGCAGAVGVILLGAPLVWAAFHWA
jgi:hypothetical protein